MKMYSPLQPGLLRPTLNENERGLLCSNDVRQPAHPGEQQQQAWHHTVACVCLQTVDLFVLLRISVCGFSLRSQVCMSDGFVLDWLHLFMCGSSMANLQIACAGVAYIGYS